VSLSANAANWNELKKEVSNVRLQCHQNEDIPSALKEEMKMRKDSDSVDPCLSILNHYFFFEL
jgi:hypothetical protein